MNSSKYLLKEYFPLFIILVCHSFLLNAYYPLTGIDVGYYSSRLLDLLLHFKNEGIFKTQWWTPSYGAGIPGFPSPVHYQYSLTPYLLLLFSPWVSTVLTYLIFNSLGYALILNYVKNHLEMRSDIATLAALVFSTSGFWICHSLVGHLSYHTFTLISVVPYILSSKWSTNRQIVIFSLTIIYMIHSGAFFPIYLTYLSLVQLLFFFMILNKVDLKKLSKVIFFSHLVIITVSISKLTAVSLHMDVIPRLNSYSTWQNYAIAFPFANFFQLFSWRFLFPIESLLPIPADSILFWICGSRYEFWENDVSVSPVVLPILLMFCYKFKQKIKLIVQKKKIIFILMIVTFWISAEISIGKGIFWEIMKNLPVIKSTHVNVRYCSSIILFLTILTSLCHFHITKKMNDGKRSAFFYSTISISIFSMLSYSFMIKQKKAFMSYDHTLESEIWSEIKDGNTMAPITKIVKTKQNDHLSHFQRNATLHMPHDPLYGYHGHYFLPATKLGKTDSIDSEGFFNFHDPFSFYYPKDKSGARYKIPSYDFINFNLFINRKQPNWNLPAIQVIANYITFISIILFCIYVFILTFRKVINK